MSSEIYWHENYFQKCTKLFSSVFKAILHFLILLHWAAYSRVVVTGCWSYAFYQNQTCICQQLGVFQQQV
jgi:hypothetical protein